jgi:hypothetical protein
VTVDTAGNILLFGGQSINSDGSLGTPLDDLWIFNTATTPFEWCVRGKREKKERNRERREREKEREKEREEGGDKE